MNKSDLIEAIAKQSKLSKKDSEAALNSFIDVVGATLKKGDKVALVGFGTFETRKRAARKGLNPQTKKPISIPAKTAPAFKAGKSLKEAVNKKK